MQGFPHEYTVRSQSFVRGDVEIECEGLSALQTAPPPQFDGPGDRWSPETLLVAAVASCYVLTFRAIAAIGGLSWLSMRCVVRGTVTRVERVTQFSEFCLTVDLTVPAGTDEEHARQLLARAKHACLITHSLKGSVVLDAKVETAAPALSI